MAYTVITSAQCDADSPTDETLMQAIRTNFEDHEARILTNESLSDNAILSDFANSETYSTVSVPWALNATGTVTLNTETHCVDLIPGSGAYANLLGAPERMRVRFNTALTVVMEIRFRYLTAADCPMALGLQDVGQANANATTDVSDFIGIVIGSATKTIRFRTALGGSAAETADLGDTTNWQKVKITVTSSAGGTTRTVAGELDGSPVTWSYATSNVPNGLLMRPCLATNNASGKSVRIDDARFYFGARPLSEA
jgi:hypothetical protein